VSAPALGLGTLLSTPRLHTRWRRLRQAHASHAAHAATQRTLLLTRHKSYDSPTSALSPRLPAPDQNLVTILTIRETLVPAPERRDEAESGPPKVHFTIS